MDTPLSLTPTLSRMAGEGVKPAHRPGFRGSSRQARLHQSLPGVGEGAKTADAGVVPRRKPQSLGGDSLSHVGRGRRTSGCRSAKTPVVVELE